MALWSSAEWPQKTVASTPVLLLMGRTGTSTGSSSEFWVSKKQVPSVASGRSGRVGWSVCGGVCVSHGSVFSCPGELTITGLPPVMTVPEGDTARLLCVVDGESVNIRWSR